MPFVIGFMAILMIAIGVRGQAVAAGQLLASEFTGSSSFIQWFLAVMILGLIGYYKPVRSAADAMLGLVIVAMILTRGNPQAAGGGFFAQLEDAFQNATPIAAPGAAGASAGSSLGGSLGALGADNGSGTYVGNLFGGNSSSGDTGAFGLGSLSTLGQSLLGI